MSNGAVVGVEVAYELVHVLSVHHVIVNDGDPFGRAEARPGTEPIGSVTQHLPTVFFNLLLVLGSLLYGYLRHGWLICRMPLCVCLCSLGLSHFGLKIF